MAKQSVTVGVEPELVRWFRDEAHIPLGEAVNEALRADREGGDGQLRPCVVISSHERARDRWQTALTDAGDHTGSEQVWCA